MSANLLYVVGSLLSWIGWYFAFRTVLFAAQSYTEVAETKKALFTKRFLVSGIAAGVLFILGAFLPMRAGVPAGAPWRFPLFWVVMPFPAWLCAVSACMAVSRVLQGGLTLNPDDKAARFKSAVIWLLVAFIGYWLFKRDPADQIKILTGGISLQPMTALGLLVLAVVATVAMAVTGKKATTRGYSKGVTTQAALVAGSIVFGVPFVFALITSFKEPQDMSSPNGIVWVPKVSQTVKYDDPKDRQFEAQYKGDTVTGNVIRTNPNGTLQVNVIRPMALAGTVFDAAPNELKEVPRNAALVQGTLDGVGFQGIVIEEMEDGHRRVRFTVPAQMAGQEHVFAPAQLQAIRKVGLNWHNYPDALEYLPLEADKGLVYLKNTLIIVVLTVIGTILSSAIVAYAFSRMSFPGRNALFAVMLSTMMLPAAVTLLPTFLIFRSVHAIDTLYPLWAPAFFGSAFNIFLLRQFFMQIPMELEDAAKIDGCSYLKTFWDIMVPQIKPALAVIAIWTFMGSWNNFMGPLIYINSPEHMPLSYALQLFNTDRGGDEPGLVMAFAMLCMAPVLGLFFFAQRYFIEGVTLSGLGGR